MGHVFMLGDRVRSPEDTFADSVQRIILHRSKDNSPVPGDQMPVRRKLADMGFALVT